MINVEDVVEGDGEFYCFCDGTDSDFDEIYNELEYSDDGPFAIDAKTSDSPYCYLIPSSTHEEREAQHKRQIKFQKELEERVKRHKEEFKTMLPRCKSDSKYPCLCSFYHQSGTSIPGMRACDFEKTIT